MRETFLVNITSDSHMQISLVKAGHLSNIGTFSIDKGDGIENVTWRFSNFVVFIPVCWKFLM